jgi:hypothetical protein
MIAVLALARRLPRAAWAAAALALLLAGLALWHRAEVRGARAQGARTQAASDAARVAGAAAQAAAAQRRVIAATAARQTKITKESDDALAARLADLGRRHDDLRLRWAAARADPGRPGAGGTIAVSAATPGAADAACAARGWVSFDTAVAAAAAADAAIAKDDAWREWVLAQAAAWPE